MTRKEYMTDTWVKAGVDPEKEMHDYMERVLKCGMDPDHFLRWLEQPMTAFDYLQLAVVLRTPDEIRKKQIEELSKRHHEHNRGN